MQISRFALTVPSLRFVSLQVVSQSSARDFPDHCFLSFLIQVHHELDIFYSKLKELSIFRSLRGEGGGGYVTACLDFCGEKEGCPTLISSVHRLDLICRHFFVVSFGIWNYLN